MKSKLIGQYRFVAAVLLTVALLCVVPTQAQETRGTIRGTVGDASGASLADASVIVTDVAKGTSTTVRTNSAGLYVVPFLIPSTYTVSVEASGFKKVVRPGIELRVGDTRVVDINLEVGTLIETVTVTGAVPILDVSTANVGQVIDARQIAELPIAHGDPYKLMGLAPGAAWARDPRLDRPFEPTHITGYAIDGTRANRSDLTIDGAPSTATADRGQIIATYVPPQDLVQEFKVQTATFDAQNGNTEGGVTALQIKSGTNDFHGTLGYTAMRPEFFANDYYANRSEIAKPDFFYHRFGGTIGGPVLIPKLYDGHKKTFFMFGMEGIKEARPRNNGTFNTPTLCMLGRASCNGVQQIGNFSELLPLGANYTIYNPFSATGSASAYQRTPFAGNIIDENLINPVARALVDSYWPDPTSTDQASADGSNNFLQPGMTENTVYYSYTARVDHNITDAQKIFGRVSWYSRNSDYNNYFHNLATGNEFGFISRQGVFDYVWSLNSTTILNARYAYNRFVRDQSGNSAAQGFDLTSVGFPQAYADLIDPGIVSFPSIRLRSGATVGSGTEIYQGTNVPGETRPNDIHSAGATLTKIVGAHSLRGGVEFRAYRENDVFFQNNQTGEFRFDNTYTQARNASGNANSGNSNHIGHAFAAFLLGVPSEAQIQLPASYAEQSNSWGFFFQDDWKVTRKLTLNLGLRWEFETPLTERFNRSVRQFDFGFIQPIEEAAQTAYAANPLAELPASEFFVRGGLAFPNVDGNPRGLYETPKRNVMPRFGFAYSPDQKTVIRGGYGIFYGFLGQRQGDVVQHGFSATTQMNITTNSGFTFNNTLSTPFTSLVLPTGSEDGGTTFLGQGIQPFTERPKVSYTQRWSFGLQRELPGGFVAETSYIGNRGTHLEVASGDFSSQSNYTLPNINVTPQEFLSTSEVRWGTQEQRRAYLTGTVTNPFNGLMPSSAVSGLRGSNIARERLLRPFPEFDTVRMYRYDGYSWYHGLQASLQKRMSRGFMVNVSYTWSKFMTANGLLNDDDLKPTEQISDMDYPHRLAVAWTWELPFGKGRALGSGANGILNHFIGDWQLGGYYQFQSGNTLGAWGDRNYFGDLKSIKHSRSEQIVEEWFDTTGFVALRNGSTIITTDGTSFANGGTPVFVDFNDPCKDLAASTCPDDNPVPIEPRGFLRDSGIQLDHHVREFPFRFSWLRSDWINNWDLVLLKNILVTERYRFQFKAEFLNAFNHPWLAQPNIDPTSSSFGTAIASTQRNYPRRMQLGLKFIF